MRIVHISDIHVNLGSDFDEKMFNKSVKILNKIEKDIIFVSGDITTEGLLSEYEMAKQKLDMIDGKKVIVPGNHDERNLGFKLFPEFFGEPTFIHNYGEVMLIGLASSEPDKDSGRLGRRRHRLIKEALQKSKKMAVIGLHHHIIPVPNSGRETNIIEDAGETLDIILQNAVPLVLMGHRHVPYGVKIHNSLLLHAGTFSCNRTRAHFGHTFNIVDIEENDIVVTVVNIEDGTEEKMIKFNPVEEVYINRYYDCEKRID
ncbi:MAG: metallophosphoesterase [Thermoplasmatales archaeon]|nr:metallophosphoesterase [Thermoplasmatales archaeon]